MKKTTFLIPAMAALALTACQAPAATTTAPTETTTQTATQTSTATETSTSTATQTETTSQAPSTSKPTGGTAAACNADNLTLLVEDAPGGTGAGHVGKTLSITNSSDADCALPSGTKVELLTGPQEASVLESAPLVADGDDVVIPDGQFAQAEISFAQVGNLPNCNPVDVYAIGVEVPGSQTKATLPVMNIQACQTEGADVMDVGPLKLAG